MRVLVAGGTGFVGSALTRSLLDDGHEVSVLGRDLGRIRAKFAGKARAIAWGAPGDRSLPNPNLAAEISGHEVVFNLAGEQAVGVRYTAGHKQRIRDSRVKSTRKLVGALKAASGRPRLLVSASAVGFYGPRPPGETVDERSGPGTGFLAELCHEWEEAALRAELFGIRVIVARLGVVLGPGGGAFDAMAKPFRLGFGGPIGDGRQDLSFVSLRDCTRALTHFLVAEGLRGPVNVTAPAPASGRTVASSLGRVLGRPNWLPVPKTLLRAAFGEGADALITGQRVLPTVLESTGFTFLDPTIDAAVATAALGT